jgi:hypothetical protein
MPHPHFEKGGIGGGDLYGAMIKNPPKSPFAKGGLSGNCHFYRAFSKPKALYLLNLELRTVNRELEVT